MSLRTPTLAVAILPLIAASLAQAAISYGGGSITQNFDSLIGNGAVGQVAWSNDATIPGWSLYLSGRASSGTGTGNAVPGAPDVLYRNNGTQSTSAASSINGPTAVYPEGATYAFYAFRSTTTDTSNVALGIYNADSNSAPTGGYLAAGVTFLNTSDVTITSFNFTYLLATSSTALTNADTLSVSYAINATGVSDAAGTFTTVAGMGATVSATGTLTPPSVTSASVVWNPGETLTIRFRDAQVGSTDRLWRVDNVSFSTAVIPEPASAALALPALALLSRRRRA